MEDVRGTHRSPGAFRTWQVQIGSSARYVPAPPEHVDRLMSDFELYLNIEDARYDPLVRAFLAHYQFETIHPFGDGNGRVGRALLALTVYKWLGHSLPWLYMSAYYEQYRDEYMSHLFRISTQGTWTEWIEFCLRGTVAQANDAILRCRHFHRLRQEFLTRLTTASPRTHRIIEELFLSPVVMVVHLAAKMDVTRQTAKTDVDRLVDAGILKHLAGFRPQAFYAPEIVRIAYDSRVEPLEALPKPKA